MTFCTGSTAGAKLHRMAIKLPVSQIRGQSYKANFGINYIKNGLRKLNFTLNYINFDVIYAENYYRIDPGTVFMAKKI